jgi:hypothetical protein
MRQAHGMTAPARRPALLTAVVVAFALALSACGSDDSGKDGAATFKTDYQAQSAKLKAIGNDLATAINGASGMTDTEVAKTFGALADRAHATADDLKDLEPTDEAKATLTKLENAVEKAAGDLDTITAAARTQNPDAAKTAAAALVAASAPIRDARGALDKLVAK